jgi:hypothetical protein
VAPDDLSGWRELGAFNHCVLEPLCWAGLLVEVEAEHQRIGESQYFKTPLWSSALKLDTDDMLEHAQRHWPLPLIACLYMEAWIRLINMPNGAEKGQLREAMLEYCKLDTDDMVNPAQRHWAPQ